MLTLSAGAIAEKDKIASTSSWPVLLELQIPGQTIRLASDNSDVTWGGQTWTAFPFDLEAMRENTKNEIPTCSIKVSNVTRDVLYYVEAAGGVVDWPIIVRVVNSTVLGGAAELEMEFVCKRIAYDPNFITFTLGGSQHIMRRVPERRYMKDFCPYQYGGVECGAPAATLVTYPTCNRSLGHCRTRANSKRFGGEQGIPTGGFYAAV